MATWSLRGTAALIALYPMLLANGATAQPAAPPPSPQASTPLQPEPANAENSSAVSSSTQPAAPAAERPAAPPPTAPASETKQDDELPVLIPSASRLNLSGYGNIDAAYTRVAGRDAALTCLGGALLVNRTFELGLAGCGVPTRISAQNFGSVVHESGDRLEFGYGGVLAGYHFFPNKIYNLSLSAMVGGGAAEISNHRHILLDDDDYETKARDYVFVAESRLTGFVNITRWARVGAFVGYRLAGGVNMRNLSSSDLFGPVAGGTMQFGWF